jgi:GT2 family glycosyltransferase
MPEARRVALRSVVLAEATEDGARITVEDVDGAPPSLPSVSIVVPTYNGILHLAPCLHALGETLPKPFDGEVIVVDDGSDAATTEVLATKSVEVPWLRVLRNDRNLGFIGSCNRGAVEAEGRFLVFLNDDTVPLQGWLQALLRTFDAFPDAGAVGGRLVYPDGRLQEAGGVIYGDGSGANIGRGDWDVDAPRYTWVREVDYCSGALLATPRDLFSELGGFDLRYAPAYYEDTDYCFRLREEGRAVYYQPRAIVVHAEGATSGVDPTSGVKRHQVRNRHVFRDRWTPALSGRASSPGQYSEMVWQRLTMIGAQAEARR